ncbi:ankyrin repeat domain-containing protein [Ramlibacter sp. XY19]|uniref:ankyrin repeat domain-containing protein n=1 Tax=Ramlibacter paludis TaxID=2908000 RepID=UPI0023DB475F|nr:ankyrin repeat domain-containing protein [Ramlibacter paludis]MCG2593569.1 ankyrin repeat domain-containing protein [Ramlibacter paludis]
MRNYLKFLAYLVLAAWFSLAQAGSYEDFFTAIKQDDARTIDTLLKRGFDPNTVDAAGNVGLFIALSDGALKAADALVASPKTRVEWRSAKDESPLMIAALRGHLELAKKLIARDADVNKTGWTPLHYAATGGHLEMIQLLLDESAYIDAESPNKTTPLMMAAQYGSTAAVKLLLESGADPTLRNELKLSATDFALRSNRKDAAELIAGAIRRSNTKGKW